MHVSATGGSLGAYNLPSGKILADVLDHQYYATGTSLDKRVDAVAQNGKNSLSSKPLTTLDRLLKRQMFPLTAASLHGWLTQ